MRYLLLVLVLLASMMSASAQDVVILGDEEQKEGWVLLGVVDTRPNLWLLGLKEKRSWATDIDFEVIGQVRTMPRVGDKIRLKTMFRADVSYVVKVPRPKDQVSFDLLAGAEVLVNNVLVGSHYGSLRPVWALVSR